MTVVDRFVSDPVVIDLGWFLLHVLWQGTLVALVLAAVLPLLDERAARLRYALSTLALASMLAVPLVTAFSPVIFSGTTARPSTYESRRHRCGTPHAPDPATSLMSRAVGLTAWAPWLVQRGSARLFLTIGHSRAGWLRGRLEQNGMINVPNRFSAVPRAEAAVWVAREVIFRRRGAPRVPAVIGYSPVLLRRSARQC